VKTAPLGAIAEIVSGATPKTGVAEYWDGDVEWATPADLSKLDGAYISTTPRKITQAGVRSCATTILPEGSVLLSSRAPIGHVAINTVPMATNQGFKSLVPGPELDAKFLYHWLKSKTDYLQSLGNGATFKELSKKTAEQIQVPLPPLPEQLHIAATLDQADALRIKRRQVLTHLDALTQSIFNDMFGDPIANPSGAPVRALREWIDPARPITYGILKPGPDIEGGVSYVRVADMQDRGIRAAGVRRTTATIANEYRRSSLRPGDLLMSIRGHVGRFAFVPDWLEGANITQDSARLGRVS
jgi:type I restriction enzyme S subunit